MGLSRSILVLGGGAALLLLDGSTRRGGRRGTTLRALLDRARPAPVADGTLVSRVRARLAAMGSSTRDLTVTVEHGCVDLRGPVATRDRAKLVQSIAALPGVDSVQDLLTEPAAPAARLAAPTPTTAPKLPSAILFRARSLERSLAPPPALSLALARIVFTGAGLGVAVAGVSLGGLLALPAVALGLFVARRALAGAATVRAA